jgi:hypothetical protein
MPAHIRPTSVLGSWRSSTRCQGTVGRCSQRLSSACAGVAAQSPSLRRASSSPTVRDRHHAALWESGRVGASGPVLAGDDRDRPPPTGGSHTKPTVSPGQPGRSAGTQAKHPVRGRRGGLFRSVSGASRPRGAADRPVSVRFARVPTPALGRSAAARSRGRSSRGRCASTPGPVPCRPGWCLAARAGARRGVPVPCRPGRCPPRRVGARRPGGGPRCRNLRCDCVARHGLALPLRRQAVRSAPGLESPQPSRESVNGRAAVGGVRASRTQLRSAAALVKPVPLVGAARGPMNLADQVVP